MGAGSSRHSDVEGSPRDVSTHRKHLRKYRNVRPASTKSRISYDSGSTKSKSLESSKKYDRLPNVEGSKKYDRLPNVEGSKKYDRLSNGSTKRSYSKKTSVKKAASKKGRKNPEKSDSGRGSGSGTGSISGSVSERDDKKVRSTSKDRMSNKKSSKSRISSTSSSSHVCDGHCSCSSDNESSDCCEICSRDEKKSSRSFNSAKSQSLNNNVHKVQFHRRCSESLENEKLELEIRKRDKKPKEDQSPGDKLNSSNEDSQAAKKVSRPSKSENEKLKSPDKSKKNKKPVSLSPSMPSIQCLDLFDKQPIRDSSKSSSELKLEPRKSIERQR